MLMTLRKPLILVMIFAFAALYASAQSFNDDGCGSTDDRRAQKYFEKAMETYYDNREETRQNLIRAVQEDEDFANAYYVLADLAYRKSKNSMYESMRTKSRERAKKLMMRVVELCPAYDDYHLNYLIGEMCFLERDFETARDYLKTYKNHSSDTVPEYSATVSMLE